MAERCRNNLAADLLEGDEPADRAQRAIDFALNPHVGKKDAPKITFHLLALKTCITLMAPAERELLAQTVKERKNGAGFPDHKQEVADFIVKLIDR